MIKNNIENTKIKCFSRLNDIHGLSSVKKICNILINFSSIDESFNRFSINVRVYYLNILSINFKYTLLISLLNILLMQRFMYFSTNNLFINDI